jgi:hypothetical protein
MVAIYAAIAFAFIVLGMLVHSRMQHRSADQKILLQKSQ